MKRIVQKNVLTLQIGTLNRMISVVKRHVTLTIGYVLTLLISGSIFAAKNPPTLDIIKPFQEVATQFIELKNKDLANNTIWLNKKPTESATFVQKKETPNNADIRFITDPHGDKAIFYQWIKNLQEEGFLEKNNMFKIAQKNGYIIGLGDYIDRNMGGIEIFFGMMQLYINNPGNVVILRGNHEYKSIYEEYGFKDEVAKKAPDNPQETLDLVDKAFELLPSACYLTWKNKKGNKTYNLLCTHGGPNLGYDATDLLQNKDKYYEWVPYKSILNYKNPNLEQFYNFAQNMNAFAWIDFIKGTNSILNDVHRIKISQDIVIHKLKETDTIGIVRGHQNGPQSDIPNLNDLGVNIFQSQDQFDTPDTKIKLSKKNPLLITIASFLCNKKTTLRLQLDPQLKNCFFKRQDVSTTKPTP